MVQCVRFVATLLCRLAGGARLVPIAVGVGRFFMDIIVFLDCFQG